MNTNDIRYNLSYKGNFFKYSTVGILFLLVIIQVINVRVGREIVSGTFSLGIAIVCMFYLWIAEHKDIDNLKRTNLQLFKAQQDLEESHVETFLSLVLSQEAKDSYTYGHSERVRYYAVTIAQAMGLEEDEIKILSRAAKLHDIGKIGIKDDVLFCEGELTQEQWNAIKSHPAKGVSILKPLKFLEIEKEIVRHHHERHNGTGYPDGLKGEKIPLGARITAVADALDAMRSHRPYNKTLTKEDIIAEFKKCSGKQFDPKVVEALLSIINRFFT